MRAVLSRGRNFLLIIGECCNVQTKVVRLIIVEYCITRSGRQ